MGLFNMAEVKLIGIFYANIRNPLRPLKGELIMEKIDAENMF
jgi:hypothetical protein